MIERELVTVTLLVATGAIFLSAYAMISQNRLAHDVTKLRKRVDALSQHQVESTGVSVQVDESSQRLRKSIDEAVRLFNERSSAERK